MVFDTGYQRVQPHNEIKGSLLVKYRLAKSLTMISLFVILLMAAGSIFYPSFMYSNNSNEGTTQDATYTQEIQEELAQEELAPTNDGKCHLPSIIKMPTSPDGTYTPPSPHESLVRAIEFASSEEYQEYCNEYDAELGAYSDVWKYNEKGECGNWQDKYTKLHERNREYIAQYQDGHFPTNLDVEERPKFVSYICKEVPKTSNQGCGGLADRMSGMISTLFLALLTDRAYLLHWSEFNPLPLEVIWERPHINWSHDPEEMAALFTDESNPFLGYQKLETLQKKYEQVGRVMFPNGGHTDWKELFNTTYLEVRSNRGYIIRTFHLQQEYKKKLNAMGLTKENTFRCLVNFLFKPTIGARRFLNAYKNLFAMESVLSIGIQIRTDDNALANPEWDVNNLEKWGHFLKCAADLANFKRKEHHKHIVFFLVTDSAHLRDEFISLNTDKKKALKYIPKDIVDFSSMVITGLPIEHIEPVQITKHLDIAVHKEVNLARMTPGVNSAYIENWLLAETQYRVISIQGYGKMAAFYSGDDRTSISMQKVSSVNGSWTTNPEMNCAVDSSFTTFDWLSTQWSLG